MKRYNTPADRQECCMPSIRPRRTALAVPASSQRFLQKAAASAADAVILDLEDGVAPSARPEARANVVEALRSLEWGRRLRTVRVNDVRTQWFYQDLIAVVEG